MPNTLSVLIIDDHRDEAEGLATLLRGHDFDVRIVSLDDAMAADPADIVVLELRPAGFDAWEVVRRMRSRQLGKQPFFVAITACGSDEDRARSGDAGIYLYLVKPFEPAGLVAVLNRFGRLIARDAPHLEPA